MARQSSARLVSNETPRQMADRLGVRLPGDPPRHHKRAAPRKREPRQQSQPEPEPHLRGGPRKRSRTADGFCSRCDLAVAWFNDGWRHLDQPERDHQPVVA